MDGNGSGVDGRLVTAIRTLLDARSAGSTICPSEAARAVGGEQWRDLMPRARDAAQSLAARGEVEITQRGEVVDLATVRGPVRIGRAR